MKLTSAQIEELYVFTRKHYVVHYDLQTELVDHLANSIEKHWQQNPTLDFEKALQIEFKKFGVFGFMEVVDARQAALGKKYRNLIFKHVKEYFKLPKILLTAALTYILYFLLSSGMVDKLTLSICIIALLAVYMIDMTRISIRKKKEYQQGKKKWMFEEMISQAGAGTSFSIIPIHFFNVLTLSGDSFVDVHHIVTAVFSFLIVLMIMIGYVMHFEIPKKAQEYLEETYPEFQLVN